VSDAAQRIADQLRRSYAGEAWHGPSLSEVLEGVSAHQAAAKPIKNAHSIWEIAVHASVWQRHVLDRLQRGGMADIPDELDWPPVSDFSESAWSSAQAELKATNQSLVDAVRTCNDETLHSRVRGKDYDFYFMLHGTIQHNLYHAGQIPLLRRAQE
jgi:uncharacterized damage-inducible protein DinB